MATKKTARQFLTEKAIEYCTKNIDLINKVDLLSREEDKLTTKFLKELKKDPFMLDWFMGEIIYSYSIEKSKLPRFCFLIKHEWQEKILIRIYKFDDIYIQMKYKQGEVTMPETIEFVKPIERTVIVHDFEVIS